MQPDRMLAISSEPSAPALEGIATNEPAFGAAALWIVPGLQEQALANGYAVVDQTSVLATHLAEIVRQYAHELLTRQETKRLLDALAESQPKLVEELVPRLLTLGEVQKVLQQLLRDDRKLKVLTLDPGIESEFQRQLEPQAAGERSPGTAIVPLRHILESLQKLVGDRVALSSTVLLCNSPVRFHLRRLLEPFLPRIVILSPAEIPPTITVQSLGVVR